MMMPIGREIRRAIRKASTTPMKPVMAPMATIVRADENAAANATLAGWLAVTIQFRQTIGAAGQIRGPMILGLALIESLVIYALIIAFMLVGKVG